MEFSMLNKNPGHLEKSRSPAVSFPPANTVETAVGRLLLTATGTTRLATPNQKLCCPAFLPVEQQQDLSCKYSKLRTH